MAGKIYKNQDHLRIRVHLGRSISDATVIIKYRDPNDVEGSWAVTAIEDELNGIVYKDFDVGVPLNVSGLWTFWSHVTFSDTRVGIGEPFHYFVMDEGY